MTLVEPDDCQKLAIIEELVFDEDEPDRSFDRLQVQIKKLLLCAHLYVEVSAHLDAVDTMMEAFDRSGHKEAIC